VPRSPGVISDTEIAYFDGFGQEAQKHESGGIEYEGDLRIDLGGLGSESVIQRISGFH